MYYKIIDPNLSIYVKVISLNFKLYPNPANNHVSIDLSSEYHTVENISIFNIHGQKIKTFSKPNKQIIKISTKNYNSGLYFIEICLNNASKTVKKLIVH